MAYEVSWYRPERVVYLRAFDAFTINELADAAVFIGEGVRNGIPPVHLIVDVRDVRTIPTNVLEIKALNEYLGHENMGWLVIVGAHSVVNMIAVVVSKLLKTKYRNFRYLEPALEFLSTEDVTLGSLIESHSD
jgi:hypothetical protein